VQILKIKYLCSTESLDDVTLVIKRKNMMLLHHPNVVLCDCDRDHGTCDYEALASYLSPNVTLGGCKCVFGYVGERCGRKYEPCG